MPEHYKNFVYDEKEIEEIGHDVKAFKTSYLIKHLYLNTDEFIRNRRKTYTKILDMIANNEPLGLPYFIISKKRQYLRDGNHRVLAMYDLGFKYVLCEVEYK